MWYARYGTAKYGATLLVGVVVVMATVTLNLDRV